MVKLPDNLIRVAEARAPEVLLAPGGYFFSRLAPLPEEVTAEEYTNLAEVTLEECSPFPLDQLAWGMMVDDVRRQLWVFAACRPRIGAAVMDEWEDAEHVFPAFLPLLLAFPEPPERLVWQSPDEVLLLEFAPGARFPTRIRHQRLPVVEVEGESEEGEEVAETAPGPEAADLIDAFFRAQQIDPAKTPIYELRETIVNDDRQVTFVIAEKGRESTLPAIELTDVQSWQADLRSPEFIEAEKRSRLWQNKLWTSLQWASWVAVALILLVLFSIIGDMLVKRRIALIAAQEPAVLAYQQNDQFLGDLRKFSKSPLRPFEVLGMTNIYLPYKNMYYRSAEVDNTDGVTIQGVSDSVNDVNNFNKKLLDTGYFENIESPRSSNRGSEIQFVYRLKYIGPTEDTAEPLAANQEVEQ